MSPGVALWHLGARPGFTFVPILPEARYDDRTLGTWCRALGYVLKCSSEELDLCKYQMRLVFPETQKPDAVVFIMPGGGESVWGRCSSSCVAIIPAPGLLWDVVTVCMYLVFGRNSGVLAGSQQADR